MDASALLPFQYEIVEELNSADALCVLCTGLGWTKPVSAFLRAHDAVPNGGAVVLLGLSTFQKEALEEECRRQDPQAVLPVDINNAVSAVERLSLYGAGRCCYVTPRILVVDLLAEKISPEAFAGMFILNAERVSENSGVEFAVRLFRLGNKEGFIRAISDQPLSFTSGFKKAEKVMRGLQVRSLSLWPRFQRTIQNDLDESPAPVTEILQPLSPAMLSIQESIKELMTALVEELKKSESGDCLEMTVEMCLFKSFDDMIRRRLDSTLSGVSWKMRQLVQDLKQLRELLMDLMAHDCVTFLSFLERIQMTGGDSIWQFHDAAHDVFEQAKRRVYVLDFQEEATDKPKGKKRKQQDPETGRRAVVRPVLEPLPKWGALEELLTEIQQEIQSSPAECPDQSKIILVVCKEMFMKNQLKWAIQDPKKLMKELFDEYLASSRELREKSFVKRRNRRLPTALKCDFSLSGHVKNSAIYKTVEEIEGGDEVIEEIRKSTGSLLYTDDAWSETCQSDLLKNVHFYPLDAKNESILWNLQPDYVIMYHPDLAFVRQIELYQAENAHKQLKVYCIYYDSSIEKSTYTASVERESEIFSSLIEKKGHITIPLDVGERQEISGKGRVTPDLGSGNSRSGRKKQSAQDREQRHRIVVDMREFMSKLPATLHRAGFKLLPVTLEVGDYILTPDIIVERKTVADLYSSMKSGRLYHQAEAMAKQRQIPMLLIEFEVEKQFRLQSDADIGREISAQNISSRLVLLILHFPMLRLVWSPSAQTTGQIFDNLKRNRSEPEDERETRGQLRRQRSEVANEKAVDILKKLPGVTETNSRRLMTSCGSLCELAKMKLEKLESIMGSKKNAKSLYGFLRASCPRI